jgi:pimeloyl-ACP methyl ester carboxylesterase
MKHLPIVLIITVLLMSGLGSARAQTGTTPEIKWTTCWDTIPVDEVDEGRVECGYLMVPEDRSQPNERQISIAVAVMHPERDSDDADDALVYLAGGPGGNAVAELSDWIGTPYLDDRTLVLFDQRGTGYSEPSLNCPEYDDEEVDYPLEDCRDRLEDAGIDLNMYNSRESAADVADLRIALGYDEWALYGISYGTRLALTVMRDHPTGINAVILDAVYPPHVQSWEEYPDNTSAAFERLFTACAEDRRCNRAYPDLEDVFWETVARLNDKAGDYVSIDPDTGIETDATLSGDGLINEVYDILYSTWRIPYLPQVIYAVADGQYAQLEALQTGELMGWQADADIEDSEGFYYSVECREELPFLDLDTALDNIERRPRDLFYNTEYTLYQAFDDCANWDVEPADALENEPVRSAIPTLIAAGVFDPITPVIWAERAAEHLSNSTLIVVPNGGHGVIDSDRCPSGIAHRFLDNPTRRDLDTSCIAEMDAPDWVVED